MLAGGVIFNLLGFTTLEHFAASLETGECHISIWGVINSMPTTILETMIFGMICFCMAAIFPSKLSTQHFTHLRCAPAPRMPGGRLPVAAAHSPYAHGRSSDRVARVCVAAVTAT